MVHVADSKAPGLSGHLRKLLVALVVAASPPGVVHAQTIAPPTREELEIGSRQTAQAGPSRLTVEGGIERGPCPLSDPSFAQVKVTFARVTFANLPGIDAQVLDSAWEDMAGRELPVSSLCEVRDRAATMLRRMGYLAAVQIPPQRIDKGGEVHMDVLAASLVEVQLRGKAGNAEKLVAAHIAKLTREKWFNVREAERHLLLLGDLPGFDVRLTLRSAGKAPGEVVGDLLLVRRRVEAVVGTQNLGSRATGREGVFAEVTLNELTGLGDRTSFSIYNTVQSREQTVLQASHDFALGSDGLRLGGSLIYGRSRPNIAGGAFKTGTLVGKLELSYPFIRRQHLTLVGSGGLETADQSVDFSTVRLSKDKLRVAFLQLSLNAIDQGSLYSRGGYSASEPRWRISAALEARQGLAGLGASHRCDLIARCLPPNVPISSLGANPNAFVLRFDSSLEYRPLPKLTFSVSPRFQYSSSQLLSFEQFSLGNYTIGRGFDPGSVLGDSGAGSSFEVRLGKITPKTPDVVALQPFAFLDAAWAWAEGRGVSNSPAHVYSAGGGMRARWGNHVDANLLVAAPLNRAGSQTSRGDVRVLFTVTARVWPWKPS